MMEPKLRAVSHELRACCKLMARGSQLMASSFLRYANCISADMARKTIIATASACLFSLGFAQSNKPTDSAGVSTVFPLRSITNSAFKPGEKLTYVLHYGWLNAGEATIELTQSGQDIQGRKVLRAIGEGHSVGAFKTFYKVDDRYESYFDQDGVFPWVFNRRVDEGGYHITQDYLYMQHHHQVTTQEKKTFDVPAHVQDMISAFYFARTWDFSNVQPGQEFTMDLFMDNENWPLKMRYIGKEIVKLRNGKYRCLKFQPIVQQGRIFKTNDDLNAWITDDANHIPVLVQAKVLVGSIKMELKDYEGLANPIAKE